MTQQEREARARMRRIYHQLLDEGFVWVEEEELAARTARRWRWAQAAGYAAVALLLLLLVSAGIWWFMFGIAP